MATLLITILNVEPMKLIEDMVTYSIFINKLSVINKNTGLYFIHCMLVFYTSTYPENIFPASNYCGYFRK